jgi:DNA-binding NarL/FixJ family response regulator
MIRVAIVDDHPAVRLGLHTALATEPGLVPIGAASSATELGPLLYRADPDVVLLDYQLPDGDGLTMCREIKLAVPTRRVILYSAYAAAARGHHTPRGSRHPARRRRPPDSRDARRPDPPERNRGHTGDRRR